MTEPQPYTEADVPVLVSWMGGSPVGRQVAQERRIATVRAYQRVLAENEKLQAEVAALREDKAKLGALAGRLLAQLRDDSAPDGGDLQDLLTAAGVIAPVQVTTPCGEHCVCAEYGFPMDCYRNAREGGEEPS